MDRSTTLAAHIMFLVSSTMTPPSISRHIGHTAHSSCRTYTPLIITISLSPMKHSSTTFAISYGLSFASITATLMHTFLYYRKQIWTQARRSMSEQADIHARLMSVYPQVPEWWYACIFCRCLVVDIQKWKI